MHTTNIHTSPPFFPQIMMISGTCVFSHFTTDTTDSRQTAFNTANPLVVSNADHASWDVVSKSQTPLSKPDFHASRVKVLASRDNIKTAINAETKELVISISN